MTQKGFLEMTMQDEDIEIAVDLSKVEDKTFPLIPKSTYRFAVKEMTSKQTGTGSQQLAFQLEITDVIGKPSADLKVLLDSGKSPVGRIVFYNCVLKETSYWTLKNLLMALGGDPEAVTEPGFVVRKSEWVGKEFVGTVQHSNNGKGGLKEEINPYQMRVLTEDEHAKMM